MQNTESSPIWLIPERAIRHLALCGLMGVGKTTIGEVLATQLEWPLLDNDVALHRLTGRTAGELARHDGIEALHLWEATALRVLLHTTSPAVVCAAASTITDPDCRVTLREKAFVVWLDADPSVSSRRMQLGSHRPTTGTVGQHDADAIGALRRAREPLFRETADLVVDTSGDDPGPVAAAILRAFR